MGVGDHDIAFDVLDAAGVRQVGQTMKITWTTDGTCSTTNVALAGPELLGPATTTCIDRVYTQAKPGETYAGSYPMYHLAPTYSIAVEDGNPSDIAASLGLGSIAYPGFKMHTSYGFVWRWTIAGTTTPTGTLTATLTPGDAQTSTPTGTSTPGDTPTTTPTGTPTGTPTPGDTPNATPTGTPPPRAALGRAPDAAGRRPRHSPAHAWGRLLAIGEGCVVRRGCGTEYQDRPDLRGRPRRRGSAQDGRLNPDQKSGRRNGSRLEY